MKWLLLMLTVASLLAVGRWWKWLSDSGEYPLDVNEDSARRRLQALMPPIHREQR